MFWNKSSISSVPHYFCYLAYLFNLVLVSLEMTFQAQPWRMASTEIQFTSMCVCSQKSGASAADQHVFSAHPTQTQAYDSNYLCPSLSYKAAEIRIPAANPV